ncbi:filamentous hemagglutinin N-terminal domain-containing protein [Paraburkholderia sp.]|uniref:filamentous hemagglutinin N-terminal domain-containing protein n=1 Tax=Paraburkholderia sp. TaxID=1926495 RepID=UPI0023894001|nr:filamentous hemagglutinin N-terminal domain-containing protein [Paraburkholderia sp.]MDE1183312.1 filamentous hemagglutinin N-terminal domain-containing protein [Paraburkholderia sp.]
MKQHRLNMLSLAALATVGAASTAMAGGIVATGGQTQVSTPGNTPVVNIAGANAAGISRNAFSSFDVDKNGVVFNNLTAAGVSQLAGQLAANANLNGTAAKVIVADVNSATASKLNGAMEVAGAPAHLLIANAAGISVNGATTINAPVLSLAAASFNPTAANPLSLTVDTSRATPATIAIDGAGLDVGAGQVNLLSRATLVNAAVKGWKINSQNGTQFDGDANGNFTGKLSAEAPNAPTVALDVSELGGMYANKIVLEGSEHGLGVNNAGVIAAGHGGLAVQMFGNADLNRTTKGMITSTGASYTVDAASMAETLDMWRPTQYRGLDEAQIFQLQKQELAVAAEQANARNFHPSSDDALLSNPEKIALVNDVYAQAQLAKARMDPSTDPDEIARNAAEAAQRAEIERQNAEHAAQIAADEKAAADIAKADADRQAAADVAAAADRAAREAEAKARWDAEQAAMAGGDTPVPPVNPVDPQQADSGNQPQPPVVDNGVMKSPAQIAYEAEQAAAREAMMAASKAQYEAQQAAASAQAAAAQQQAAAQRAEFDRQNAEYAAKVAAQQQMQEQIASADAQRSADADAAFQAELAARYADAKAQYDAKQAQQVSYAPQAQPVMIQTRYTY